jgi:putative membrane protein
MSKNTKTALIIGGIIVAVAIIVPSILGAIFGWQNEGWGMMGSGMWGGFGWMWLMPVFGLIVPILIIWAIVALVRGTRQSGSSDSGSSQAESALEILKKRYARGEINKEEYEEKKKGLT